VSEKMACPACSIYTSEILRAYQAGAPCPNCGLEADTAAEVFRARQRGADAELTKKYMAASMDANNLQQRVFKLEAAIKTMQRTLDEVTRDLADED
jgi:predicted RNA-binding Zn-ribbon protein involved in translation (DUF1610 family)